MLRGRMGGAALLVCAAAVLPAAGAFGAGEEVKTTASIKKASKITQTKPGLAKVSWSMVITKPDGSRPANLSKADLTLPKGLFADTKGYKTCPIAKLQANDNKSCPAKSIVGKANAHITAAPVRDAPYAATGIIYLTGAKGKRPTFATYYTLTEIPSAHSVTTMALNGSKLHFDQPRIPSVPGLPDATPLDIRFDFTAKGKATVFRLSKPCKRGTSLSAKYGFYDGSSASSSAKGC
jgi:hypothetical protein